MKKKEREKKKEKRPTKHVVINAFRARDSTNKHTHIRIQRKVNLYGFFCLLVLFLRLTCNSGTKGIYVPFTRWLLCSRVTLSSRVKSWNQTPTLDRTRIVEFFFFFVLLFYFWPSVGSNESQFDDIIDVVYDSFHVRDWKFFSRMFFDQNVIFFTR